MLHLACGMWRLHLVIWQFDRCPTSLPLRCCLLFLDDDDKEEEDLDFFCELFGFGVLTAELSLALAVALLGVADAASVSRA